MTVTLERKLPNDPLKVGRRWVRSAVRSWPSERFFCSLGLRARGAVSLSCDRCRPNGSVNVGPSNNGGSAGTVVVVVAAGLDEEAAAFSLLSFSRLNFSKYLSEANSVM
jgi:hypothetical protein